MLRRRSPHRLVPHLLLALFGSLAVSSTACQKAAPCDEAACAALLDEAKSKGAGDAEVASQPSGVPEGAQGPGQMTGQIDGALNAFEAQLLADTLSSIREGVTPFEEDAIGVCAGHGKACERFLGADVESLPPGDYMLSANLRVPNIGPRGTWKVILDTTCEVQFKDNKGNLRTSQSQNERSFDVSYSGENRGYRLSPLRRITSPSKAGKEVCTYTLHAPKGDGENTFSGSWVVPQAGQ